MKGPQRQPLSQAQNGKNAGFTLIEVSLALIFLSILAVPMILQYNLYIKELKKSNTTGALTNINSALQIYVPNNAGYPLPASLAAAPGDGAYGMPGATLTPTGCGGGWLAAEGYCTTGGANPVLIGGVPFAALGINEDDALDYWGNKIIYAVTASRTDLSTTYDPTDTGDTAGGITVQAYDGTRTVTTVDTDTDVFLLSSGPTGRGGYTRDGQAVGVACVTGTPETEDENCDFDATFFLPENPNVDAVNPGDAPNIGLQKELSTAWNDVDGNDFFDDYTRYIDELPVQNWFIIPAYSDNAVTLANRIGIGTQNPQAKLHVMGNISVGDQTPPAGEGQIRAPEVCNGDGSICLPPVNIAGDEPDMDCRDNNSFGHASSAASYEKPITSIGNNRVRCGAAASGSWTTKFEFDGLPGLHGSDGDCAVGDMISGFDASGAVICTTP